MPNYNKYRGIKTFDSRMEARKYCELKLLEKHGKIKNLQLKIPFEFIHNGKKICTYITDFVFEDQGGKKIVMDVKGMRTPVYRLKYKMMKIFYGIEITETH